MKTLHKGENCEFSQILSPSRTDIIEELLHVGHKPLKINGEKGRTRTVIFKNPPKIIGRMSVAGTKESKGPIGRYFHKILQDDKNGEKSFEKAEIDILTEAIDGAIVSAGKTPQDIDLLISGDLLNQITTSSYVARHFGIPYYGIYGACSSMSQSLSMGAAYIDAGFYKTVACATSSHFATAERQFRFPLEYGCQRPPYAQWTVTAAGCAVLSSEGCGIKVVASTVGKVIDYGTNDLNNMGAAMAPAALDTLSTLFAETDTSEKDYDLILTGDLGKLGSDILRTIAREREIFLGKNYIDCGSLMYDVTQKCYQGGSGCGCSASALNSFIIDKMEQGHYNRVALLATGALMSTQSCYQGETIPCVAHAVILER